MAAQISSLTETTLFADGKTGRFLGPMVSRLTAFDGHDARWEDPACSIFMSLLLMQMSAEFLYALYVAPQGYKRDFWSHGHKWKLTDLMGWTLRPYLVLLASTVNGYEGGPADDCYVCLRRSRLAFEIQR